MISFEHTYRSDGTSLIDIGMALGTGFSVIVASIVFKLSWGLYTEDYGALITIRLFTELVLKRK
ncbi:hypothetical protein [Metabacillus endolithicus]|uniref:hypothetical protein n=1 Tax=Metabacillus endolithicus TaxID=1535204 RepID=UPI00366DAAE1